jgi:prephenate dehydrogenase
MKTSNRRAVHFLEDFWSKLGCRVQTMTPAEHDRIFARVSHLPHVTAAALLNATHSGDLRFAGKGFIDTSRIASGPANIWTDVLLTNAKNTAKGIDKVIGELMKLKNEIERGNRRAIEKTLEKARDKRNTLIQYKIENKEILS